MFFSKSARGPVRARNERKLGTTLCVITILVCAADIGFLIWYRNAAFMTLDSLFWEDSIPSAYLLCAGAALLPAVFGLLLRWPHRRLGLTACLAPLALVSMFHLAHRRYTPNDLVNAATDGDLATVKRCLADGLPVDSRAKWGWMLGAQGDTALAGASFARRLEIAGYLLDHGGNANPRDGWNFPLYRAVRNRDVQMVKLLIDHGADANEMGLMARPLLFDVARIGNIQIAHMLLDAGEQVDVQWTMPSPRGEQPADAQTLIDLATKNEQPDVAQLLREALEKSRASTSANLH
jgi:hypothetical protein